MSISLSMRCAVFTSLALGIHFTTFGEDAPAFEGRIRAEWTQDYKTNALLYTIGPAQLRVKMIGGDMFKPEDVLDRESGAMMLVFPDPGLYGIKPLFSPVVRQVVFYPVMPVVPKTSPTPRPGPPIATIEFRETGHKKRILGYPCGQYEILLGSQSVEIWATDQLAPFQPYLDHRPFSAEMQTVDTQWGDLLRAKKLFPLLAVSKSNGGVERFRFEVKSIAPEKLADNYVKL